MEQRLDRLADLLRNRQVSSVELVEECLRRVETGRQVNAVVEVDADSALRVARAADHRLRAGGAPPPLCGIPFTVKRTFRVRDLPSGELDLPSHRSIPSGDRDAVAVSELRAAGAVVLGLSNAPSGAADIDTFHARYGRTRNPANLQFGAGGSSGGSAAAVAAGHVPFDLASDTLGSGRIPAHCCGVYALRPSEGAVSVVGHVPGPSNEFERTEMLTVSPVTRHATDLRLLWEAGWGSGRQPATSPEGPRRIAAVPVDPSSTMSAEVASALARAHDRFRAAGFQVEEVAPPVDVRENWLLAQQLLFATQVHDLPGDGAPDPGLDAEPAEVLAWVAGLSHRDWLRLDRRRAEFQAQWRQFFARYPALLLPVLATPALPPRDHRIPLLADRISIGSTRMPLFALSMWCAMASVAGLPAVSMPVGITGSGLPVGLQVVAWRGRDTRLLRLVEELAAVMGPGDPGRLRV
ncbi:MAG: amidase family protein [Natronosporangium sp.]